MSVFIEIHAVQSVPPSNLNRDDTNSPKSAFFGGVKRHRVSSQAWKRAVRSWMAENSSEENNLGVRTRKLLELWTDRILARDPEFDMSTVEKRMKSVKAFLVSGEDKTIDKDEKEEAGKSSPPKKTAEPKEKKDTLIFLSNEQIDDLVDLILGTEPVNKKSVAEIAKKNVSLDIALFGRMIAGHPDINVEAASQMAHALSTHKVDNEFDFYTAVDDFDVNGGSAMMGDIEFNSSTLYRYTNLNVNALVKNMNMDVTNDQAIISQGVEQFIKSFLFSMPTGKQNSFAARTLPEAILITLRTDQPISLSSAFERPVRASVDGYLRPSVESLVQAAQGYDAAYGADKILLRTAVSSVQDMNSILSSIASMRTVHESVDAVIEECLKEMRG